MTCKKRAYQLKVMLPALFMAALANLLLLNCSAAIKLDLPSEAFGNEQEAWLMLGRNLQHQHYSDKNINPPLEVVWQKSVRSVVTDHPLALGDFILAPTRSGIFYAIDYETGGGVGVGKIGPALLHTPSIYKRRMYLGLILGEKTFLGIDLQAKEKTIKGRYPAVNTSPIAFDNRVFFGTGAGRFYCVNAGAGSQIWEYKSEAPILGSPALLEERVFFADEKGWVYCLESSSGAELWKRRLNGSTFSHPVLDDSTLYIGTTNGLFYALHIRSGKVKWEMEQDGAIYGSPSLYENMLYIGNNAHQVLAVQKDAGKILWKFETGGIVNTTPLPSPDYLYVVSWDKHLYVLNRFTGKELFNYKFKRPPKSSPIIYRDLVLVHTANHKLFALGSKQFVQSRREKK